MIRRITSDCQREVHSNKAPDPCKDGFDLARRRFTTLGVCADQDRLAALRPGHGNVASGVLAVVAGFVADPPVFWEAGAQPVVSGLTTQHPACESRAGAWRQYLSEDEAPQVTGHGGRRGVSRFSSTWTKCLVSMWMSADRVLLAANDVLNRKFAPLVDDGRQVCAGN